MNHCNERNYDDNDDDNVSIDLLLQQESDNDNASSDNHYSDMHCDNKNITTTTTTPVTKNSVNYNSNNNNSSINTSTNNNTQYNEYSPATQTLNALQEESQNSVDLLHYFYHHQNQNYPNRPTNNLLLLQQQQQQSNSIESNKSKSKKKNTLHTTVNTTNEDNSCNTMKVVVTKQQQQQQQQSQQSVPKRRGRPCSVSKQPQQQQQQRKKMVLNSIPSSSSSSVVENTRDITTIAATTTTTLSVSTNHKQHKGKPGFSIDEYTIVLSPDIQNNNNDDDDSKNTSTTKNTLQFQYQRTYPSIRMASISNAIDRRIIKSILETGQYNQLQHYQGKIWKYTNSKNTNNSTCNSNNNTSNNNNNIKTKATPSSTTIVTPHIQQQQQQQQPTMSNTATIRDDNNNDVNDSNKNINNRIIDQNEIDSETDDDTKYDYSKNDHHNVQQLLQSEGDVVPLIEKNPCDNSNKCDDHDDNDNHDSCDYTVHTIHIQQHGRIGIKAKKVVISKHVQQSISKLSLFTSINITTPTSPKTKPKPTIQLDTTVTTINIDDSDSDDEKERYYYLQVDDLAEEESPIAKLNGILPGDYIFATNIQSSAASVAVSSSSQKIKQQKGEEEEGVLCTDYDAVVKVIGNPIRPITLYAIRRSIAVRDSNHIKKNKSDTVFNKVKAISSTISQPKYNVTTEASVVSTRGTDNVPFCALCNGRKTSQRPIMNHHCWCPKNKQFVSSGADEVLTKIRRGIQQYQCNGCQEEYNDGRRVPLEKHSESCKQDGTTSNNNINKAGTKPGHSSTKHNSSRNIDVKSHTDSPSSTSRNSHNDDEDEDSVYMGPSKKKQRGAYQTLKVVQPPSKVISSQQNIASKTKGKNKIQDDTGRSNPVSHGKTGTNVVHKKDTVAGQKRTVHQQETQKAASSKKQKPILKTSSTNASNKLISKAANDVMRQSKLSVSFPPEYDNESIDEYNDKEKLHIEWDDCDNIWGPDEFLDNDIIIFSTNPSISTHYETILCCDDERYEIQPFHTYQQYHTTHSTPEEGYHAITLRRDLYANRPWGFTCHRHEFGGACLITSVVPLSPAMSATLIGTTNKAPLRVNDMIIAINGKSVGGMTTTGLEIDLDLSGPDMIMIVSRYKFPEEIHDDIVELEQDYIDAIDLTANDIRKLDWTDYGDVVPNPRKPNTVSHVIRPSPVNISEKIMDDSTLPESDSDETMDAEPIKRVQQSNLRPSVVGAGAIKTTSSSPYRQLPAIETSQFVKEFIPIHRNTMENVDKIGDQVSTVEASHSDTKRAMQKVNNTRKHSTQDTIDVSDDNDEEDDGNAWCGCVCGETHLRRTKKHPELFWIQCDVCASWYDCSSICVGFSKIDVKKISSWVCWGCPLPEPDLSPSTNGNKHITTTDTEHVKNSPRMSFSPSKSIAPTSSTPEISTNNTEHITTSEKISISSTTTCMLLSSNTTNAATSDTEYVTASEHKSKSPAESLVPTVKASSSIHVDERMPLTETIEKQQRDVDAVYSVNDFVYVKEHGWAGVNNPEGIAKVLRSYVDDDDDKVYDIRYIIGGNKSKGVLAEYLSRHTF